MMLGEGLQTSSCIQGFFFQLGFFLSEEDFISWHTKESRKESERTYIKRAEEMNGQCANQERGTNQKDINKYMQFLHLQQEGEYLFTTHAADKE